MACPPIWFVLQGPCKHVLYVGGSPPAPQPFLSWRPFSFLGQQLGVPEFARNTAWSKTQRSDSGVLSSKILKSQGCFLVPPEAPDLARSRFQTNVRGDVSSF